MALTEKVTFLLSVNAKGVAKEFDKVGREADRSLGKAEERSEKLSATFTKVGAGMVAAGALAGAALYGMAQDAAAMAETVDKATILFGDGLDRVIEFSDGAAKSLGIAKDQALDAASTFAIYGKRAGLAGDDLAGFSTELVQIAGDMASFNNASIADTIEAIGSGLRGESEPLQKFGVDTRVAALEAAALEAGMIGVGESLTEAEKPMAVLAAITQQASDQMGNFELTSASAANQQKQMAAEVQNLRLELGEAALPVLQSVLTELNKMVSAFNDLPGPIKNVVAQTAVWGSGLLIVGGSLLMVVARAKELNAVLTTMSTRFGVSRQAMLGWIGVAGIAVAAQQEFTSTRQRYADAENTANDSLVKGASAVENYTNILNGLAMSSPALETALSRIDGGAAGLAARFAESGDKGAALDEILAGMVENGFYVDDAFETATVAVASLANATDDVAAAAEEANGSVPALSGSVDSLYRNAHKAGDAVRNNWNPAMLDAKVPVEDLDSALSDLNRELDEFFGTIQGDLELAADFEEAIDDAISAINDSGASLDADTEAGRNNIAARGDLIGSIQDTVGAMIDQGATSDEIVAKASDMIQSFKDQAVEAGISEDAIDDYTEALEDVPEQVRTELELANYDTAIERARYYKSLIDDIPRQVDTFVNLYGPGSASAGGGSSSSDDDDEPQSDGPTPRMARRPRSAGSFSASGEPSGKSVNHTTIVELDGREIVRSIERVSERDGGLRIKTRAGG